MSTELSFEEIGVSKVDKRQKGFLGREKNLAKPWEHEAHGAQRDLWWLCLDEVIGGKVRE